MEKDVEKLVVRITYVAIEGEQIVFLSSYAYVTAPCPDILLVH